MTEVPEKPGTTAGRRQRKGRRGSLLLTPEDWAALADRLELSRREVQIVQAIFDGSSDAAAADDLGISVHTVREHVKRLYAKLDVSNHRDLIVCVGGAFIDLRLRRHELGAGLRARRRHA